MTNEDAKDFFEAGEVAFRAAVQRFRPELLVGLVEDEARRRVESAGGILQAYAADDVLTMDLRYGRVRAEVSEGRAVAAAVG